MELGTQSNIEVNQNLQMLELYHTERKAKASCGNKKQEWNKQTNKFTTYNNKKKKNNNNI